MLCYSTTIECVPTPPHAHNPQCSLQYGKSHFRNSLCSFFHKFFDLLFETLDVRSYLLLDTLDASL
jgi:hypothetical protein